MLRASPTGHGMRPIGGGGHARSGGAGVAATAEMADPGVCPEAASLAPRNGELGGAVAHRLDGVFHHAGPQVPPRVVMQILGRSQIALTMNTYSHVAPEISREAADRIAETLLQHDEDEADDPERDKQEDSQEGGE